MGQRLAAILCTALLPVAICSRGAAQAAPALGNPSFEAVRPLDGWELKVYGAQPTVARDGSRGDRPALRIAADAPSDAALGQEIRLTPAHCYRLCGWVRTHGLDPRGAPVFGTYQVQLPGGRGVLASGASHGGDTAWTEVTIPFVAPADGRVRICVFFVGFGRGVGAAWFSDLTLDEVNPAMSPIVVTREPLCSGRISPFQCGQFIEYLCDLVPGMWAEKLCDGSFEGLTPYRFVFLKETDDRQKRWYPIGAVNRAEVVEDGSTKVSGDLSERITVPDGPPCTVGIAQDGIAVQKSVACDLSIWLRAEHLHGPVTITLHRGAEMLARTEFAPTADWKRFQARMAPARTESSATLSISFRGPGSVWIDNASLMPENSIGGWRPDVVSLLRALKPGIIRFGGSALDDPNLGDFEWRDTIGDPDHRRPFRAWGGLQPAGPGLEEIVQLCRVVGAEPLICVRFTRRTPQDAADEVQYFNGGVDTPMGALRARNGHPKPYGVVYWQIGNEQQGEAYEAGLPAFCRAMKQADPSIKLLSSFPTPGVLRGAGEWLSYVCPHQYGCADLAAMQEQLDAIRGMIRQTARGRDIRIAVTEWNTTAGDAGPRRAMLWTLANALACARYQNLLHRNSDIVEIANRSNLTNSFCSGIIQTENDRAYVTPTFYAQRLYAECGSGRALRIDSDLPPALAPDISAVLSSDGKTVTLFAVNDTMQEIARPIDLTAYGDRAQQVDVVTLKDGQSAGEPDATNSFDEPLRIRPHESTFDARTARFVYRFEPLSLTVLRWRVRDR